MRNRNRAAHGACRSLRISKPFLHETCEMAEQRKYIWGDARRSYEMTRFSYRQLKCGARVLSLAVIYVKMFFHLHQPPFIPLVPYPPLRGTFPSRGRLTIRGYRHLKCGEAATRALMHLSTKIGHETKKIRHKNWILVQDTVNLPTSSREPPDTLCQLQLE